jgi:hypothetical protein
MARDRDLLEIFDAVLPRLKTFRPGSVAKGGADEAREHERIQGEKRTELGIWTAATGVFAGMAWVFWGPWFPIWIAALMVSLVAAPGAMATRAFLQLAFGRRLEQSLPPGTDSVTAQLEDGTRRKLLEWNYDAHLWNERVTELRVEVSGWQAQRNVEELRGVEWTEKGSRLEAEGLIAAIQGLAADRAALVARRDEIEHHIRRLSARLHQLKASEEAPTLALPAPADDPDDPSET